MSEVGEEESHHAKVQMSLVPFAQGKQSGLGMVPLTVVAVAQRVQH